MSRRRKLETVDAPDAGPGGPAGSVPALESALGYKFRDPKLLELALTHRSHPYEARGNVHTNKAGRDQKNEPGTDNEQLEFVGDAVLGLVVTEALYRSFPHCSEGELTRLRASLVSRQRMAQLGTELSLGEYLRMGKSAEANLGRRKPALLANAAEAVLAAVYLDAGGVKAAGLSEVQRVVQRLLIDPELPKLRAALAEGTGGAMRDGKTLLQERVQAESSGKLRYVDIAETGPAHQRKFEVEVRLETDHGSLRLATAQGSSKKEAQQKAASLALAGWNPDQAGARKPAHQNPEGSREHVEAHEPVTRTPAGGQESEALVEGAV